MSIMTGIVGIIGIIALTSVLNNLIECIWYYKINTKNQVEDKDFMDLIKELEDEEVEK